MSKRKYIESHWLVFAAQGLIGLLFGWYVMFTGVTSLTTLVIIVATTLLALAIIDMLNLINRKRRQDAWVLTLILALIETVFAVGLLVTINNNPAWPMFILAGYTLFRGLFEILIGFKSMTDPTDRFMWVVCGICGCILAFVIMNSGHFLETTTFIRFFGTYMMIYGVTALIYGVHNKNEQKELKETRSAAAKKAAKTRKSKKSDKKFKLFGRK